MKVITKTIWVLSFVSLLTDVASEMLYPVMPLFLKHIGYTALFIGLLEGVAEAVAGLSKGYFGKLSDVTGKRLPFVQVGYAFSTLSKPMLALFIYPFWIFFSRTIDRLGKGIRSGARDALLSDECTPATRGQVFGFHRSMDTMGAVLGPAISLVYLYFNPDDYTTLFLIAFTPGLVALLLTFLIKERQKVPASIPLLKINFFAFGSYWKTSPNAYKKLVTGFLLFAVFNSSDVFLLLRMKEAGLSDVFVIGIYIFYNLVFSMFAYPLGLLADKLGLKIIYISGITVFSLVYIGFAFTSNLYVFTGLFALYGIYAAATEGISKAWISNVVDEKEVATAIGSYSGFQSFAALIASSLCGFLWFAYGSTTTFLITAFITIIVIIYMIRIPDLKPRFR